MVLLTDLEHHWWLAHARFASQCYVIIIVVYLLLVIYEHYSLCAAVQVYHVIGAAFYNWLMSLIPSPDPCASIIFGYAILKLVIVLAHGKPVVVLIPLHHRHAYLPLEPAVYVDYVLYLIYLYQLVIPIPVVF